ncbi:MAG: arylesterase [Vicinamibacterales bacterium]
MKGPLYLLALLLTVSACTRADEADTRAATVPTAANTEPADGATSRPRIVFLGDSLTAGLGLERSQSVPSLIQSRLDEDGYGYEVVNAGVSGDTSAGGLRRLDWSLAGDVRVLVVELGANDGLRGLPTADLKKNLTEVITAAKARGIKVLLTGMEAPPNYGVEYTTSFRQVYHDLAAMPGVTFMPFYLDGVAGSPTLNQRDGIHPNPEGARIVERNVWRSLEPLLDKSSTR